MTMTRRTLLNVEPSVARCRVLLSVTALFALLLVPAEGVFRRGDSQSLFVIDIPILAVMLAYLAYSVALYYALTRHASAGSYVGTTSTWGDVLFSAAIAYCSSGTGIPFYVFFAFAVMGVAFRAGLRQTLIVTGVSIGLYLSLILVSPRESINVYVMRVVYLAIIGYLVGYLGQERLNLEARICDLVAVEQRTQMARELHDGCVQTLAAVNLQLEGCKELLQRGQADRLLAELGSLQTHVASEHVALRAYMRSLAGQETTQAGPLPDAEPRFSVSAEFAGSGALVEQVLQIIREGVTNIRRHAQARSATIEVQAAGSQVFIEIDDDGVGFPKTTEQPWSISSRVHELGGHMRIADYGGGAHLVIALAEI